MFYEPSQRLRWAIVHDKLSIVENILKRWPDLLENPDPDHHGWTSLHYAAHHGRHTVCVFLIAAGHDRDEISVDFARNTALHLAARENREQTVHYLSQHLRRCLAWPNADLDTPLLVAARSGHQPCVALLLDFGADVDQQGRDGDRAIHIAAAFGHVKTIRTLVERKADLTSPNTLGWTPRDYCATYQVQDFLSALIADRSKKMLAAPQPLATSYTPFAKKLPPQPISINAQVSSSAPASMKLPPKPTTPTLARPKPLGYSSAGISSPSSPSSSPAASPVASPAPPPPTATAASAPKPPLANAPAAPSPLHHSSTILSVPLVAKPQNFHPQQYVFPPPPPTSAPASAATTPVSSPKYRPQTAASSTAQQPRKSSFEQQVVSGPVDNSPLPYPTSFNRTGSFSSTNSSSSSSSSSNPSSPAAPQPPASGLVFGPPGSPPRSRSDSGATNTSSTSSSSSSSSVSSTTGLQLPLFISHHQHHQLGAPHKPAEFAGSTAAAPPPLKASSNTSPQKKLQPPAMLLNKKGPSSLLLPEPQVLPSVTTRKLPAPSLKSVTPVSSISSKPPSPGTKVKIASQKSSTSLKSYLNLQSYHSQSRSATAQQKQEKKKEKKLLAASTSSPVVVGKPRISLPQVGANVAAPAPATTLKPSSSSSQLPLQSRRTSPSSSQISSAPQQPPLSLSLSNNSRQQPQYQYTTPPTTATLNGSSTKDYPYQQQQFPVPPPQHNAAAVSASKYALATAGNPLPSAPAPGTATATPNGTMIGIPEHMMLQISGSMSSTNSNATTAATATTTSVISGSTGGALANFGPQYNPSPMSSAATSTSTLQLAPTLSNGSASPASSTSTITPYSTSANTTPSAASALLPDPLAKQPVPRKAPQKPATSNSNGGGAPAPPSGSSNQSATPFYKLPGMRQASASATDLTIMGSGPYPPHIPTSGNGSTSSLSSTFSPQPPHFSRPQNGNGHGANQATAATTATQAPKHKQKPPVPAPLHGAEYEPLDHPAPRYVPGTRQTTGTPPPPPIPPKRVFPGAATSVGPSKAHDGKVPSSGQQHAERPPSPPPKSAQRPAKPSIPADPAPKQTHVENGAALHHPAPNPALKDPRVTGSSPSPPLQNGSGTAFAHPKPVKPAKPAHLHAFASSRSPSPGSNGSASGAATAMKMHQGLGNHAAGDLANLLASSSSSSSSSSSLATVTPAQHDSGVSVAAAAAVAALAEAADFEDNKYRGSYENGSASHGYAQQHQQQNHHAYPQLPLRHAKVKPPGAGPVPGSGGPAGGPTARVYHHSAEHPAPPPPPPGHAPHAHPTGDAAPGTGPLYTKHAPPPLPHHIPGTFPPA